MIWFVAVPALWIGIAVLLGLLVGGCIRVPSSAADLPSSGRDDAAVTEAHEQAAVDEGHEQAAVAEGHEHAAVGAA